MSAWGCLSRGCVCQGGRERRHTRWGVAAQRGCMPRGCLPGTGCLRRGIYSSLPLPVNRMTDRCKNITFPLLHLRTVMKTSVYFWRNSRSVILPITQWTLNTNLVSRRISQQILPRSYISDCPLHSSHRSDTCLSHKCWLKTFSCFWTINLFLLIETNSISGSRHISHLLW